VGLNLRIAPTAWDDPFEDDADNGFGEDGFGGGSFGGEAPFGLRRGMRVQHPQFGVGQVMQVTGAGGSARVKVRFNEVGLKTLILEYARLEILS